MKINFEIKELIADVKRYDEDISLGDDTRYHYNTDLGKKYGQAKEVLEELDEQEPA